MVGGANGSGPRPVVPVPAHGRGLKAHLLINREACTTLQEPLWRFFLRHQAFIDKRAKDPDTKKINVSLFTSAIDSN